MNLRVLVSVILAIIVVAAGLLLLSGLPAPERPPLRLAVMTASDLQSQVGPYPNETGSPLRGQGVAKMELVM